MIRIVKKKIKYFLKISISFFLDSSKCTSVFNRIFKNKFITKIKLYKLLDAQFFKGLSNVDPESEIKTFATN